MQHEPSKLHITARRTALDYAGEKCRRVSKTLAVKRTRVRVLQWCLGEWAFLLRVCKWRWMKKRTNSETHPESRELNIRYAAHSKNLASRCPGRIAKSEWVRYTPPPPPFSCLSETEMVFTTVSLSKKRLFKRRVCCTIVAVSRPWRTTFTTVHVVATWRRWKGEEARSCMLRNSLQLLADFVWRKAYWIDREGTYANHCIFVLYTILQLTCFNDYEKQCVKLPSVATVMWNTFVRYRGQHQNANSSELEMSIHVRIR